MEKRINMKKGFTLIEVIVVLVIIAVLAAAAIPTMFYYIDREKENTLFAEAKAVYAAALAVGYEANAAGLEPDDWANPSSLQMDGISDYSGVGKDNFTIIFDSGGNIIYDQIIDAQIINIKFSEDYKFLYFLTRAGLYRVNIEQKIFELAAASGEYDETTDSIVYANDRNIYLSGLLKINAVAVK